jgi:hypothetical protein
MDCHLVDLWDVLTVESMDTKMDIVKVEQMVGVMVILMEFETVAKMAEMMVLTLVDWLVDRSGD